MPPVLARFLRRDPLLFAALAAVVGILSSQHLGAGFGALTAVAAGLVAAAVVTRRSWCILLAVALCYGALHQFRTRDAEALDPIWRDAGLRTVTVQGTVVETPLGARNRSKLTVRLRMMEFPGGRRIRAPRRVHVWTPRGRYRLGDRIKARGLLIPLPSPRNPGEASSRAYARATNGVVGEVRVGSPFRIERLGVEWRYRIFEYATRARTVLGEAISHGLPPDSERAGLLKAMVLGARDEASPESEEQFRRSGAMHIFAVSGLHVGIFGSVIWLILRSFGVSRQVSIWVIAAVALGYAFVTGLRPSAVRAAIMLTVFLAGFALRRQPRLLNSVGLAALCILAFDTRQLFTVGFQLSFSVLVAIGLLANPLRKWLYRPFQPDPFLPSSMVPAWRWRVQGAGRWISGLSAISLSAFIGSWPWVWWYFGLITPVGLLANFFFIPLAWLVIGLATVSMLLGAVRLVWLVAAVNWVNGNLVHLLHQIAIWFASVPGGHFELTPLSEIWNRPSMERADFMVLDAGRGCGPQIFQSATDRPGPPRSTWVIDTGAYPGYSRVLRPWLRNGTGRHLDGVIATHGDKSHIGGVPSLVREFEVERVLLSALPSMSPAFRDLRALKEESAAPLQQTCAGEVFELDATRRIEVVFPPAGHPDQSWSDDECLVLLIHLGGWRILSVADSGFNTEKWILRHRPDLRADVLVKGRHGNDHSGLPEFLRATGVRAVVATNDSFPENEAIPPDWRKMVDRLGIVLLDQLETGAVMIDDRDETLVLRPWLKGDPVVLSRRDQEGESWRAELPEP